MQNAEPKAGPVNKVVNEKHRNKAMVSVVVPAYNEASIVEKSLAILCQYLETLEDQYRWEIILVNDGSSDNTGELADTFASTRDNVHVLHHITNFRMGQALQTAFHHCKGDYIIPMDIDLSFSPEHIGDLLNTISTTKAKIVIASPYMEGGKLSNVPWHRRILSKGANRFLSFFAVGNISSYTTMCRAYDAKFLSSLDLRSMDVEINAEILYKAMVLRARIIEIPAHLNWNLDWAGEVERKSSVRIFKNILGYGISGFMFRPFMFFILPSVVSAALALYMIVWIFINTFIHYTNTIVTSTNFDDRFSAAVGAAYNQSPHAFIVGGITLLLAFQLFSLGILALQNKRYFEELFHLGSTVYKQHQEEE